MSRRFAAFAAALAIALSDLGAQDKPAPEQVLTLEQSRERALQNNQRLLAAREDIRIAEQRVAEARSQYLPKINLNMSGTRYLAEQDYVTPPEYGTILLRPSRNLAADNFYSAKAWLRQPLYDGGRSNNTVRLAQANLNRARIAYDQVKSQVELGVELAFNDWLLRRTQIAIYDASMNTVDGLARRGPRGSGDAAQLQALRARLRRELANARRQEEKAQLDFLNAMGVEFYTQVDIKGKLETRPVLIELPKLLAWAQESRPEIRGTDYQQEIDRLAVNLSLAERYPVVAFGAGYELNDQKFPLKTTNWATTLNINLPVFDGFSSRARIRQRRAQVNQSRILRTEIEDKINYEVRDAYAEVVYWQDELKAREQEVVSAGSDLEKVRKNSGGAWDVARAGEWDLSARIAYWEAVHAHASARATLEKSVGRPLPQ